MKAWITKYALTGGIQEVEAREIGDGMISVEPTVAGAFRQYFHGEGREWHKTREAAEKRAEGVRVKKVAALNKQIAKLERLNFGTPSSDAGGGEG